jgi:hypothetical protein
MAVLGRPTGVGTTGSFDASGKGGGIKWLTNPFHPMGRGGKLIVHMYAGLAVYTTGFAVRVQEYAQENAPWADRTGEARQGLKAIGEQRLTTYSIILFHTVDYGIWLEVRWDGRFAIIIPTIEVMGPELMSELSMYGLVTAGGG